MRTTIIALALITTTVHAESQPAKKTPRIAAIVTVFRHNSHAEMIVGRVLRGYELNDKQPRSSLKLVSLYVDQTPRGDLSRDLAKKHKVRLSKTIADALTLGTGKLAVDGVILVAEHGKYPYDPKTGAHLYPKARLFKELFAVFKKSKRAVPVFTDKHLSHDWKEAARIYSTAKELKIPLMAGSSVPTYKRFPKADVDRKRKLKEIVAVGYGGIESYGFHALEMMQSLAERRTGGETGVISVTTLSGEAVWKATGKLYDPKLLDAAWKASDKRRRKDKPLKQSVRKPVMFAIAYADGLRASVFMLNGTAVEFSAAWQYTDDAKPHSQATVFRLQEPRPYRHFTTLLRGIERMMHTGKPTWPAERTLLTTGLLHAAMQSHGHGSDFKKTPHLRIEYQSRWDWKPPAEPKSPR